VIGGPERRGKGRGIREAVRIAQGQFVGFADADNKVPIDELDKVMPLLEQGCAVVIGSRALDRSLIERAQPLYRRLGSRVFAISMRLATGLRTISDTQCGFKFFQHDAAKEIFSHQKIDGYMFDVAILILARHFGMSIHEVPIRWRDDGDSRLDLVSGNLRNVRDIFRIRMGRNHGGVSH
jgi:dolichyl-phosphate beta-glucosyltransferase